MPFEFGDVVLVPFPFTSQRESKKRPAVVVSNRAYSTARLDLLVMAVTSRLSAESRVWRRMGQPLAGRRVHGLRRDLTDDSDGQAWTDPPRAANGARSALVGRRLCITMTCTALARASRSRSNGRR